MHIFKKKLIKITPVIDADIVKQPALFMSIIMDIVQKNNK